MRYIIILSLSLITACKSDKKPITDKEKQDVVTGTGTIRRDLMPGFPRFVHNVCTGKWAILTYRDTTDGRNLHYYLGDMRGYGADSSAVLLGFELQFPTEDSAMHFWSSYYYRNVRSKEIHDSIERRNQYIRDSIFRCEHTYQ